MDHDSDLQQRRYRLCRWGFGLTAVAFSILAVSCVAELALYLSALGLRQFPKWSWIFDSAAWTWLVSAPVTALSLAGAYLLWGRWDDAHWQRRAGLLVVMSMIDAILWAVMNSDAIGIGPKDKSLLWVIGNTTRALGWAEFALTASLAVDLATHLGLPNVTVAGRTTRSLIASGAIFWFLSFLQLTDWSNRPAWPPQHRPVNAEALFLVLGPRFLYTLVCFQVIGLCVISANRCREAVAEIDREERESDPLRSRSERVAEDAREEVWR